MQFDVKKSLDEYRYKKQEAERTYYESKRLVNLGRRLQNFEDQSGRQNLTRLKNQLLETAMVGFRECEDTEKMIGAIKDAQVRDLFCKRYIEGMKWDDVAAALNYDIDSKAVYKMHKTELKKLQAQFGKDIVQ